MVIDSKKKIEAFRLSAVLYADNNYEVSPKTILRKIIESVFMDNENKFKTIPEILDEIENTYDLLFSEYEVTEVLKKNKNKNFLVKDFNGEISACLTYERNDLLKKKIEERNIAFFLEEFINLENDYTLNSSEIKSIIYRFLYEVFNTNIASFNKLIDSEINVDDLIGNLNYNFKREEALIINDFLKWNNDGKNKAIFDISNFALEYCLISNKKPETLFHLKNLKNKTFYLDTNVIFRAIGVNGQSRKKRTLTFLDKFKEAEEKLLITKYTEEEFFSTINHYIQDIGRNISPRVNSSVFLQFSNHSEFYNYYFEWKKERSNDNLDLFKAHLETLYEDFKNKYRIKVLKKLEFDETDEEYLEIIRVLAESIYSCKRMNALNPDKINYNSVEIDAKNIAIIEKTRGEKNRNIFETKNYFISTDQQLKKWDMARDNSVPIVLLPSQWLTILLRYHNRSNDDFKSFVSFLNLSNSENVINNRTLTTVLNGISEITVDAEKQSLIVSKLIENKFKDIIKGGETDEELEEVAKAFAKTELEKRVEELESKTESIQSLMKKKNELLDSKEKELTQTKKERAKEKLGSTNLIETVINTQLSAWQNVGYWFLAIAILCTVCFTLIFVNEIWNPIFHLKTIVNELPKESLERSFAFGALYALFGIGSILFFTMFYNRKFNSEKIRDQKNKLKEDYKSEY